MKFTRDRYQQGSLRRVQRAKGPDVWEFRFSTREVGVRRQRQITLSTKKFPTEAAARRKVEALVLNINSGTPYATNEEPTLGAVMDCFLQSEMPERPKSRVNYQLLIDKHIRPRWGELKLSKISPYLVEAWLRPMAYAPETKRHIKGMTHRLFELAMKREWLEIQRNL